MLGRARAFVFLLAAGCLVAIGTAGCDGDDGGGRPAPASSASGLSGPAGGSDDGSDEDAAPEETPDVPQGRTTLKGNVSQASTAAASGERSWLVWMRNGLRSLLGVAHADNGLEGILVVASAEGGEDADTTDASGSFELRHVPSGDVTVTFQRDDCEASLLLESVVEDAEVALQEVDFACDTVEPSAIVERFRGVVTGDGGPEGEELTVCVRSGDSHQPRVVSTEETKFEDANGEPMAAEDLREGDLVRIRGPRDQVDGSPDMSAHSVRLVASDQENHCPAPTPAPEDTPTPGGAETPVPTDTPGSPGGTATPATTGTPEATPSPQTTGSPEATASPEATVSPASTATPQTTETEAMTPSSEGTATPTPENPLESLLDEILGGEPTPTAGTPPPETPEATPEESPTPGSSF